MNSTPRVALYLRVSTADQTNECQQIDLQAYCARQGWTTPTVYQDVASGGAGSTRPQLERMLAEVRPGKINVVVVTKLDRLGRSLSHLALILEQFRTSGCGLIAVSQGIDTRASNPMGALMLGVLGAVSEFELALIRERTRAGLVAARARGQKLGKQPLADEVRQRILAAAARVGPRVRQIARELGIPPSTISKVEMNRMGGDSINDIAKRNGVSAQRIHTLVKEFRATFPLFRSGNRKTAETRAKMSATHRARSRKKD